MHTIATRTLAGSALLLVLCSRLFSAAPQPSLFGAIRQNDPKAVAALLHAGADANAADETGATPLMHAAIYAGPDVLRQLIARGAQVNAANRFGATALMWATPRAENVQALLEKGADVNARASNGWTPLTVATRVGNLAAMKMLLAGGADIRTPESRRHVLTGAMFAPDPAVARVLREAGLTVTSTADLMGPVLNRALDDVDRLKALLALGYDPKEELATNTIRLPTFFLAARDGQLDAMAAFVDKGMNAAHVGARATTALMLAAGAERPNVAALQFLLDRGSTINAVDDSGRTALDWALTRGETDASAFLRRVGGRSHAAPVSTPPPVARPRAARDAIELAIGRLQPASRAFTDRTKCSSCHNESLPGIAVALARERGLVVDEALAEHSWSVTTTVWEKRREAILLGDAIPLTGVPPSAGYGLLEMALARRPPTAASDVVVLGWARRQQPNGSWDGGEAIRPPLNGSSVAQTALAVHGIRAFAPPGTREEMEQRVRRARAFLGSVAPTDTQEHAFRLLGLIWSGAPQLAIDRQRATLLALQRTDGGWGQMPTLGSDAYATGQTLYALHAAGVPATGAQYRRGVEYLLRTQLEDGTWFVPTRAFGVQPYFETGFPHGRHQFISATATAWAAISLSFTLDR